MAFVLPRDFVKETTTVTGTGAATLLGARAPGQRFNAVCSNGDTVDYAISHQTSNEWEVGTGTYNANVLTRTTVLDSSNGGAAVNFSVGTKSVDLVDTSARISRRVGPVVIGAVTQGLGSILFSNGSGVSWGLSTNSAGGTITASVNAGGVGFSAGGSSATLGSLIFANGSGVSFGLNGSTLTASVAALTSHSFSNLNGVSFGVAGSTVTASVAVQNTSSLIRGARLLNIGADLTVNTLSSFSGGDLLFNPVPTASDSIFSIANVSWRMATNGPDAVDMIAAAAVGFLGPSSTGGAVNLSAQYMSIRAINGVSVTLQESTFAAFGRIPIYELSAPPQIGMVSHVGGNSVSNVTQLAFSNASNVTFSLSTAAGAATVFASVAAGGGGGADGFGTVSLVGLPSVSVMTDGTGDSVSGSVLAFPLFNTASTMLSFNNVSFGLSSNTMLAAAWQLYFGGTAAGQIAQNLSFVAANGNSWTISSTSAAGFGRIAQISLRAAGAYSAGTAFQFAQNLRFVDSNGIAWSGSLNGNTFQVSGSYTVPEVVNSGLLNLTNAASSVAASALHFSNANGLSWLLSTGGSVATLSASYTVPTLTSLSFSNANGISFGIAGSTLTASQSTLSFSNLNGVTFGIAGSTLTASVAAGGGGGVTLSGFDPFPGAELVFNNYGINSVMVHPFEVESPVQFDRVLIPVCYTGQNAATNSVTIRVAYGVYTRNNSSLSLLFSGSASTTFSASNNTANHAGFRHFQVADTETMSAGNYWIGVVSSGSVGHTASASVSFGMAQQGSAGTGLFNGIMGSAINASRQPGLGRGIFSSTTTAPPSVIPFASIIGTGSGYRAPLVSFVSQTF